MLLASAALSAGYAGLDAKAAYARLKTLAGSWVLTVFHLDGDRLILTHYCMAGNQPRMQATSYDAKKGEIRFQFLDATNLARILERERRCRSGVHRI